MRTIFISSFHPIISRNIIATEIIPTLLKQDDLRVVVIAPDYKLGYFEKAFARERLIFEGVSVGPETRTWSNLFFKRLSRALVDSPTTRTRAGVKLRLDHAWFYYFFFFKPLSWASRFRLVRTAFRLTDGVFARRNRFSALFNRYSPNLVFSTDVQLDHDVELMREAKRRGVKVISKVRSWDNLTQWGLIRVMPSQLMVPTELAKEEAIILHDIHREDIAVVGIPHYDRYLRGATRSREDFLKSIGADPEKKLIFYAPLVDYRLRNNDADRYILEILATLDATILVRFPPNDEVSIGDFKPPANMIFNRPGVAYDEVRLIDRDLSREDDEFYINALAWCDVGICGPSTVAIDLVVFDKPIILINFSRASRDFWHGIVEYRYSHILDLLGTGGTRVAASREELLNWIARYLAEPRLDCEGRERLRAEQCWKLDGQSSARVAKILIESIG